MIPKKQLAQIMSFLAIIEALGPDDYFNPWGYDMDTEEGAKKAFSNKFWRLNNLYWIMDEDGKRVKFRMRFEQWVFALSLHTRNTILKVRQLGFTTLIDLFILDEVLFIPGIETAIIAQTEDDAKDIFRRKIKFPYDNMPAEIRAARPLATDSKTELEVVHLDGNGKATGLKSILSVDVSKRSSTLQYLHVSEFGEISVAHPDKALEIMTGTLETVSSNGMAFFESTAKGNAGFFYDMVKAARSLEESKIPLTPLDFKFHFFSWFDCPKYTLKNPALSLSQEWVDYFAKIESQTGRTITVGQKAWYLKKHATLGPYMKREYPSTPDEAFETTIEGAYFDKQFTILRKSGHITKVPVSPGALVDTYWDLGMDDAMSIWFVQNIGREFHMVKYFEDSGEGLEYYRDVLWEWKEQNHTRFGDFFAPHDIEVREMGTGVSRYEQALKLGIKFTIIPRVSQKIDAINEARLVLPLCWFDEAGCARGLGFLEKYQKEWDERHGQWKNKPLHNECAHAADSFMTFAQGRRMSGSWRGGSFGSTQKRQVVNKQGVVWA